MNSLRSTSLKVPIALICVTCLILILWLYAKFVLFNTASYTSDLFLHLQLTFGWLEGKPLLYENCFGDHSKIHNYYLSPLLAPFTYPFGAYGLFIAHFLLYLGSIVALLLSAKHAYSRQSNLLLYFIIFVFLLGPLAFRIWDNPHYGFHVEMLYIPLSIFLVLALEFRRLFLSLLTAALIVIVKEDGAVLGACLHLSWLALRYFPGQKQDKLKLIKVIIPWLVVWLMLFLAGTLLLSYKNDFQGSRIGEVLDKTAGMGDNAWAEYFSPITYEFLLLLLPLLIFIVAYLKGRNILLFLLFLLPVIVVELVSGLYYYPATSFSIIWTPRLAVVWAFVCGYLVMTCFRREAFSDHIAFKYSIAGLLLIGAGLYYLQIVTLNSGTEYIYTERLCPPNKLHYPEEQEKMQVAQCIADQLPLSANVAPPHRYFGAFPYNTIVWYDHMENAYTLPDIVLVDATNTQVTQQAFLKEYRTDSIGRFQVFTKPELTLNKAACVEN